MTVSPDTKIEDEAELPGAKPAQTGRGATPVGLLAADRRPLRQRAAVGVWLAGLWLILLLLVTVFADLLPLHDYTRPLGTPRQPPGFGSDALLGTDTIGRSQLSRLVYGARQSLLVAGGAVAVGLALGGVLGLVGGYFRRRVDAAVGLFTDSVLAIPPLLLLIAVTAFMSRNVLTLVLALAFLSVPTYIRVARAHTLTLSKREFVQAALAVGSSRSRIIFKELLPNVMLPLMSYVFLITAQIIVAEGTLSFLGLGIPPPLPSWGGMIRDGQRYLATEPVLVLIPAAALSLTVMALNIVGDHARVRFELGGSE